MSKRGIKPGGASTINGVLYQMLYSLLKVISHKATVLTRSENDNSKITLLLEPLDGGDIQSIKQSETIVEQIKARSTGTTWSIREIIDEVLPDLFLAVDSSKPNMRFRFVAEGRMGDWQGILDFFENIKNRNKCDFSELNQTRTLDYAGVLNLPSQTGKRKNTISEQELVAYISDVVAERQAAKKFEKQEIYERVIFMLTRIEFQFELQQDKILKEIDKLLLATVSNKDELQSIRDSLITRLAKSATFNSEIDPVNFLKENDLDVTPLLQMDILVSRNRKYLTSYFRNHGYVSEHDVRKSVVDKLVSKWNDIDILLISGESGLGKSWCLCSIAENLISRGEIVILIDSQNGTQRDNEEEAARVFSHEIWDQEGVLYIDCIAKRLLEVTNRSRDIFLLIDGVNSYEEVRSVTRRNWSDWGIKIGITCIPDANIDNSRLYNYILKEFTEKELQNYLQIKLGDDWPNIPSDIRSTLRVPLLAQLYCDTIKSDSAWQPSNEYELYSKYYARLKKSEFVTERSGLKNLAYSLLNGSVYPWPDNIISKYLSSDNICNLTKLGWLRYSGKGYEIIHGRLLNWLVAEAIVDEVITNEISKDDLFKLIEDLLENRARVSGTCMGYVILDVLYLILQKGRCYAEYIDRLIEVLGNGLHSNMNQFYSYQLPAFGSLIVPFLFEKLKKYVIEEDHRRYEIIKSLREYSFVDIESFIDDLISDESSYLKRAALQIIKLNPSAKYLDRIWKLHCDAQLNYNQYLHKNEKTYHRIYDVFFEALKACTNLDKNWLKKTIIESTSDKPVHDLAYLLAINGNQTLWQECKKLLFEKVKDDKIRCLANCISVFNDDTEIEWLKGKINIGEDLLGASVLRALSKISPEDAVDYLDRCENIYFSRGWHIHLLLKLAPEITRKKLLELLQASQEPWQTALFYQGSEDDIDYPTLNFLLDKLENILDDMKVTPPDDKTIPLWHPLDCLSKLWGIEHIECFQNRKDSSLETKLTDWLLQKGGLKSEYADDELSNCIQLLYKIGGAGFRKVVRQWLDADSVYAKFGTFELALKNYDEQIIQSLEKISKSDELYQNIAWMQNEAAFILECLGHYETTANFIVKWGLKTFTKISEYDIIKLDSTDSLKPIFKAMESSDCSGITAGHIIALGTFKQKKYIDKIFELLCTSDIESDLVKACIIALGRLQAQNQEVTDKLGQLLIDNKHKHVVSLALLQIDSSQAKEYLLQSLEMQFDLQIASYLIRDIDFNIRVVEALKRHLNDAYLFDESYIYHMLLDYVEHNDNIGIVFDAELEDNLLAKIFYSDPNANSCMSKTTEIKLFSYVDKSKAMMAAKLQFENKKTPERSELPDLMMSINEKEAKDYLFGRIYQEEDVLVQWAIGRALSQVDLSSDIEDNLKSGDKGKIITALRIAGWCIMPETIICLVKDCLLDGDWIIENEAKATLKRICNLNELEKIFKRVITEDDYVRKWIYLDAALNFGDQGEKNTGWPEWLMQIRNNLTVPMRIYANDFLKKKREKLEKLAKKVH